MTLSKRDLADIVKAQIDKALRHFETSHNKTHKTLYIEVELAEFGEGYNTNATVQQGKFGVEVRLKVNGVSKALYRKAISFNRDDDDARLTIYQDIFYQFVGMGIIFNMAKDLENEAIRLQSATTRADEQATELTKAAD